MRRKRFSLCERSTTQRLALNPAWPWPPRPGCGCWKLVQRCLGTVGGRDDSACRNHRTLRCCRKHGAVHTQPTPVQPLQFVIAFQSHPPQLQEHPSGNPFLKAQVGGGPGADARGVQRLPTERLLLQHRLISSLMPPLVSTIFPGPCSVGLFLDPIDNLMSNVAPFGVRPNTGLSKSKSP